MDMKTNLKVMMVVIAFLECESAALLQTPKVYNALITTDQNLNPSRVYPVQTFHNSPFYFGAYGYNFGHFYDPYAFNPFEPAPTPPMIHKLNANFDGNGSNGAASAVIGGNINNAPATDKASIPLNEFGFPASLVPINPGKNSINLAPFPHNSYPTIYDQFNAYPQNVYLPHFGVVPQSLAHLAGSANKNVNGNPNDKSNDGKLPVPDIGLALGENPIIATVNGPFDVNPALLVDGNPAFSGPAGDSTGFNGNPFIQSNAAAVNAPAENPFLASTANSVGPNASVQPGRVSSTFNGRNENNNNNGSKSTGRSALNPVFFDRAAGVNAQNSSENFRKNSQKQAFKSNFNGEITSIGANSRSALDSDFWQGSGIGSENSQENGFQQELNSGSQGSQLTNSQGDSSGSSSSFQSSKRGIRQNLSENRTNTNANRDCCNPYYK